jgi:hypothetical protein
MKKCQAFHWIGQSMRSCDNCGRPTWEHIADYTLIGRANPFGSSTMGPKLRKRSRIERDRAITAGLASGQLVVREFPKGSPYEFEIVEPTP